MKNISFLDKDFLEVAINPILIAQLKRFFDELPTFNHKRVYGYSNSSLPLSCRYKICDKSLKKIVKKANELWR